MSHEKYKLHAKISSDNPSAVRPVIERIIGRKGEIKKSEDGFEIETELLGESAKDLNRQLLSEIRRAEKRTRLRSEWTSNETVEKFFDYVSKGVRKTK